MRKRSVFILSIIALFVSFAMSLVVGENGVPLQSLFEWDFWKSDSVQLTILCNIRMPRALMAIACGSLLSLSGVVMQGVFRNPLVDPYTMGLSGGALLGVSVVVSFGLVGGCGSWLLSLSASAGSLLVMLLVLTVRRRSQYGQNAMLLTGVMISFVTSSVNMLLMSVLTRENLSQIVGWSMGSFDAVSASHGVALFVVATAATVVSPFLGNLLNVLSLGDDVAGHLGVDVRKVTTVLFVVSTVASSLCVAEVGIVAFVGMVVPHVVRKLVGVDNCFLLPVSGIVGGVYLLSCDVVAREILYPRELPAGVFCGILGGLAFVFIMIKGERYGEGRI